MLSVTIGGHTYTGNPPALTLFQRDPASFVTIAVVVVAALLVAGADLSVRSLQRSSRACGGAIAAGGALALFSLFGLLWGVASLGVIGILLVLSGLRVRVKSSKQ